MPVYVDKKTKRLFIQFRLHGETYKERLPEGTKKSDAEKLEIKVKSQMLFEQHGIIEGQSYTFERFIQDYYLLHIEHNAPASLEKALYICKAALTFFKGKQMRSIKPADIERFKASRFDLKTQHKTQRKPATVHRELCIISGIFTLAVKNDICDYNPVSRIKKPQFDNVVDKVLSYADEAKLFAKMHSPTVRDICLLVLHTGLRQNDVLNLTKFEVDIPNALLRITQGKTKKRLEVDLNSVALEIVKRRSKNVLLFPSPKTGKVIKNGRVRHTMLRACKRAKIDNYTIRDLRRTYSTRLQEHGVDAVTNAAMMGHSDTRMIHRYARSREMRRKAVESLVSNAPILPVAQTKKA